MFRADGSARRKPGRKKTGKRLGGPHRVRPDLDARHPVHVVLRGRKRLSWRRGDTYRVLARVLAAMLGNRDFRICHISIQQRHLHLLVEAASRDALSAGMKSFATRAARALNRADGGFGKVFEYRYHASQITTARYARHALAYVLNNWRRHREDFANGRLAPAYLDEFSSAVSFRGWTIEFAQPEGYDPLRVSAPRTWLLREGWKRYGAIDPHECPGPLCCGFSLRTSSIPVALTKARALHKVRDRACLSRSGSPPREAQGVGALTGKP